MEWKRTRPSYFYEGNIFSKFLDTKRANLNKNLIGRELWNAVSKMSQTFGITLYEIIKKGDVKFEIFHSSCSTRILLKIGTLSVKGMSHTERGSRKEFLIAVFLTAILSPYI